MPPANVPNSESAPWNHADYMWQAIAAATNAPQAPFGAVIVNGGTGQIIARGWNKTGLNPLLHGEIDALQDLFGDGPGPVYRDLALYTTAEPCPMCMGAILWSGIRQVVFGTSIETLQRKGWRQIEITCLELVRRAPAWNCDILGGVLESECDALFGEPESAG